MKGILPYAILGFVLGVLDVHVWEVEWWVIFLVARSLESGVKGNR